MATQENITLSWKNMSINTDYQEIQDNVTKPNEKNDRDNNVFSVAIHMEVSYDRFREKGRKTKEQKMRPGKNLRKQKNKQRHLERKKAIRKKDIENFYFSPEEQQDELAEHTARQNHEIEIIQPEKKRRIKKNAQILKARKEKKEILKYLKKREREKQRKIQKEKELKELQEQYEERFFDRKPKTQRIKQRKNKGKYIKKMEKKNEDQGRKKTQMNTRQSKNPMAERFYIKGLEVEIGQFDDYDEKPFMTSSEYYKYKDNYWLWYDSWEDTYQIYEEEDRQYEEVQQQQQIWYMEEKEEKKRKKKIMKEGIELLKREVQLKKELWGLKDEYYRIQQKEINITNQLEETEINRRNNYMKQYYDY